MPRSSSGDTSSRFAQTVTAPVALVGGFLVVCWVLEVVDVVLRHRLDAYGVAPRHISGLRGIVFAPFLHVGFAHLIANSVPFAILGWLTGTGGIRRLLTVYIFGSVVGGLGTWLIGGSNTVHIGASGIVFAFLGYLLSRGIFERKFSSIAVSVVVGVIYAGLLQGVLPSNSGVSWEGHLFGFIGGVLAAWTLSKSSRSKVGSN